MTIINTARFSAFLRIWIVLFSLVLCINSTLASENGIYDSLHFDNGDDEYGSPANRDASFYSKRLIHEHADFNRRDIWSRLFRSETSQPHIASRSYFSRKLYDHAATNGRMHTISIDKLAIPIELQKALYAHGIVGR
ncbi:unnamed protein product [Rotaria socialis]|uniref:Uncharacterized protein n=1 Tax=Rotaria socialis TaxID=392032 RepID=A0A817R2M8_9BILA|nr:unnamed protein product [Rotaria socialis]CAF3368215.1 unnamed protein product [Rotaria socialis]CAF4524627.1 unnamed protein product [Rotaria socialis]CAF4533454.1 unnamed protein product [Rotaria socialis]